MGYIVALTGGIGSGKSTIANAFAALGIDIVDADVIARQVVAPRKPALAAIRQRFGDEILQVDGTLNRATLRQRIFSSVADKKWINNLLHPLIQAQAQKQLALTRSPWSLWVVPLLVENQLQHLAKRVLVVDLDNESQRLRIMHRDRGGISREQVNNIIASQSTRAARLAIANDIIDNRGSLETLITRVAALNQRYLALAAAIDRD